MSGAGDYAPVRSEGFLDCLWLLLRLTVQQDRVRNEVDRSIRSCCHFLGEPWKKLPHCGRSGQDLDWFSGRSAAIENRLVLV